MTGVLFKIDEILWGDFMTYLLIAVGLFLTVKFGGRYNFNLKAVAENCKHSFGCAFRKDTGTGTVSSFASACTALANTVGVGNISGVATAIVAGGPGAILWMWIAGLLGMSTKASEIILGQRYRVKYKESIDEYLCDRAFVMKNAFGWKKGAMVVAIASMLVGPWLMCVQTEAVVGALDEGFGVLPIVSVIVLGTTCFIAIAGGLRRISKIMEKVFPLMAIIYILGGIGILLINIKVVPEAFALIFKSALSGQSAVGGFAGATVRDALRFGVARGMYSNDACSGYGIIAHAPAKTDHPVRQASWGWGEVFLDTIIVCSVTALSIIVTGSYTLNDVDSSQLTTMAFKLAYGQSGGWFMAIVVAVFAWTTIIGMYYSCEKSVNYAFGDTKMNKIATKGYMVYYMIPVLCFYNMEADSLWAMTDIVTAGYVFLTLFFIVGKRKEITRLYRDYWFRFLPAKNRGEKVEDVVYVSASDKNYY